MQKKKNKIILLSVAIFIFINFLVYIITTVNKEQRIDSALNKNITLLKDNYNVILNMKQKSIDIMFESILIKTDIVDILKKANKTKSDKELNKLRIKLLKSLELEFELMKKRGVKLGLITLSNNKGFLRLHKPDIFGDDISKIRYSIEKVSKEHKILRGFEKGKISYAIRNIYPIFDENGVFLGSFDISFHISILEKIISSMTNIDAHLLIHKDILNIKKVKDIDNVEYIPSVESSDYKTIKCKRTNHDEMYHILLESEYSKLNQDIKKGMKKEKPFSVYFYNKDTIKVVSLLPIKNIKNDKTVIWLVSHKKNNFIKITLKSVLVVRVVFFVLSLILVYFFYKILLQKYVLNERIKKQTQELKESNQKLKELTQHQEIIIEEQIKVANEQRDKAQSYANAKSIK